MNGRTVIAVLVAAAGIAGCTAPGASVGASTVASASVAPAQSATPVPVATVPAASSVSQFAVAGTDAWALSGQGLLATTTAGAAWATITPTGLDLTQTLALGVHGGSGWLVTAGGDGSLLVVATHDAGTTWTKAALPGTFPDGVESVSIDAVDAANVWVVIKLPFSPAESIGDALRSTDGGSTWTSVNVPSGEPVSFRTDIDGWQVSGAVNQTLNRTQDGGKTWQPVKVAIPQAYAGDRVAYSDPIFFGPSGVLPVMLWVPGAGPLIAAFYTSADAGSTWMLSSMLRAAPDGASRPVAVTGPSSWIIATDKGLTAMAAGGAPTQPAAGGIQPSNIAALAFGGTTLWAIASSSSCTVSKSNCATRTWLERSVDNGANWADATP
jgi:hypothetical protein